MKRERKGSNFNLILILVFSLIMVFSLMQTVYAASNIDEMFNTLGDGIKSIYDSGITPLAKFLIGQGAAEGENGASNFFTLIVFFLVLISVLWMITDRIPIIGDNWWAQFIVSFSISIISTRFLGSAENLEWFKAILLPYNVVGVALLCVIPLIVYFFFVENIGQGKPVLRKILFLFAAVVFLALYFTRYEEFAAATATKGKSWLSNPVNIYFLAAIVSLIFLVADGTIARLLSKAKTEMYLAEGKNKMARDLLKDMADLDEHYAKGRITRQDYSAEMAKLKDRYQQLKAG